MRCLFWCRNRKFGSLHTKVSKATGGGSAALYTEKTQSHIIFPRASSLILTTPSPLFTRFDQSLSLTLSIHATLPLLYLTLVIPSLIRQTFSSLLQTHVRTHANTHTHTHNHGLYKCEYDIIKPAGRTAVTMVTRNEP